MEKLIIILFTLIINLFSAQTNRFIYEMEMKLKDKPMKMNMVLDIDKDYTKFYDYDFLKNDSISKKTGENWQTNTQSDQLILRKANSNENRAFHGNMFDYFVIDSKDEMNWKIEKETKKNAEYSLQKATTDFGGRKWIAWFTSKIPINEGPYKFFGLPGLIVKIEDSEHEYSWELKGNILCKTNCNIQFDSLNERQIGSINVSKEKIKQLRRNYAKDPLQGADVVNPNLDPALLREYKNMLIKKINYYDNPIERN